MKILSKLFKSKRVLIVPQGEFTAEEALKISTHLRMVVLRCKYATQVYSVEV